MDREARVEQLEIEKDDLDNLIKEFRSRVEILEHKLFDSNPEELTATKRLHRELSLLVSDLGQSSSRSAAPSRSGIHDSSNGSIKLKSRCAAVWESSAISDTVDQSSANDESFRSDLDFNESGSNLRRGTLSVSTSTLSSIASSEATATTVISATRLNTTIPETKSRKRGRRGRGGRVFRNSGGVYPNLNVVDQNSSTATPVVVLESTQTAEQTRLESIQSDLKPNDSVTRLIHVPPASSVNSKEIKVDGSSQSSSDHLEQVSKKTTTACCTPPTEPFGSMSRIRVKLPCNHEYNSDPSDFLQLLQTCKQCYESDIDDSVQDPFSDEANFLIPDSVLTTWRQFLLNLVAEAGRRSVVEAAQFSKFREVFEQCRMSAAPEQFFSEMQKALSVRTDSAKKKSKYVAILTELFREMFSLTGYRSPYTTSQLKLLKENIDLPVLQLLLTKFIIKCYSRSVFETPELRNLFLQPALDSKASICYRFVVYVLMHVYSILLDCASSKQQDFSTWLKTECFPGLYAAMKYPGVPIKTREYIQRYTCILKTMLLRDETAKIIAEVLVPQPKPKTFTSPFAPCVVQSSTVSNQKQEDHLVLTPSYIRHFAELFEQNKTTDLRSLNEFIKSHFSSKKSSYVRSFVSTAFSCAFTLDTQRQASNIGSILSYMIEMGIVTKEKVIEILCTEAIPTYSDKLACGGQGAFWVELGVTIIVKALFRSSDNLAWMAKIVDEVALDNREQFALLMLTKLSEKYTKYFVPKLRCTSSRDRNVIGRKLCKSFMEDNS